MGVDKIMIKMYGVGVSGSPKMYFIDSNILLSICQFYYKGKCDTEGITEDLVEFILEARKEGIHNELAITEICYNYNSNSLNCEQMQKIMIAYDNLVVYMSEKEIRNHGGTTTIVAKKNDKRSAVYKTIFECKLPEFFFTEVKEMKIVFYEIYLYLLKIYSLYNNHTMDPMDKVKELYRFMTEEIDLFLGYEFYMGVMLFIGVNQEKNIAKGIFKPRQSPELHHILNCAIDVFQYRMVCISADSLTKAGFPVNAFLVTLDESLQEYIEHNVAYNTVLSQNMITPVNEFLVKIDGKYEEEWKQFYREKYGPEIYERYMNLHLCEIDDATRNEMSNKICDNIVALEKEVLTSFYNE